MFANRAARDSFDLRPVAPTALLFSNLGAVQLNRGFDIGHCREAVSAVGADGLYLHLNPLQEAVQPEGDTDFTRIAERIGEVAESLEVPVLVKEVGAGISAADAELLVARGVRYIDVAGAGGTSWSRVEHHRQPETTGHDLGRLFQDWGLPTPEALRALAPCRDRVTLVASGGIRSGLDMAKAIILGASLCGVAAPFLKPAMESVEQVVQVIERFKQELVTAMFLLGVGTVSDLLGRESLIVDNA
jgi:isopentenyl-diphosphate delta-isomerase